MCHLFRAQLQLVEGPRDEARDSLAAAAEAAEQLPEGAGATGSQFRLHVLLLETLRQLASGETGSGMRTGTCLCQGS